ncbi:MAG: hypothetical protein LBT29_04355 [Flavobacteriaceae bacterium]|jgi:hypothetical protein|nr:hypothetical protein [Flavobacteriaceae bacterium]
MELRGHDFVEGKLKVNTEKEQSLLKYRKSKFLGYLIQIEGSLTINLREITRRNWEISINRKGIW